MIDLGRYTGYSQGGNAVKLKKSVTGKILIPLYYTAAITGCTILSVLIFCNAGILAGLAFSLVSGSAIGILGGELEYRDHVNELYTRYMENGYSKLIIRLSAAGYSFPYSVD
jgi:hypothetical protein